MKAAMVPRNSLEELDLCPLRARRLGIHSLQESIVFMRTDCYVCRSEGLSAHSRVRLSAGGGDVIATLFQVSSNILAEGEAGLSEAALQRLGVSEGSEIAVSHTDPIESRNDVRALDAIVRAQA